MILGSRSYIAKAERQTRRYAEKERTVPLRETSYNGCRLRFAQNTDDLSSSVDRLLVTHLVADIVKMKEEVNPIAANAELVVASKRVTDGSKEAPLQASEGLALLLVEPALREEPKLGFGRREYMVRVAA